MPYSSVPLALCAWCISSLGSKCGENEESEHHSLSLLPGPLHSLGWVHVLTHYQIDASSNRISIKNHREETEDLITEQRAIKQAIEQEAIWQQEKCRRLFKTWRGHLSWILLIKC